VVAFVQTMEFGWVPNGMETRGVHVVRSTVLKDVAPPPSPMPAATHVVGIAHEIDVSDNTDGRSNLVHVFPSWVPTIDGIPLSNPTATQVVELGQDTPDSEFNPEGAAWAFQSVPSAVPTIPVPPTAVHSSTEKQEIDRVENAESCIVQFAPPSLDFMMPAPPPA
jgi:hypothetical protein